MSSPDPNRAFAIPSGYSLSDSPLLDGDDQFDWDSINDNSNLELWLIRIPNGLSAKHLQSIPLSLQSPRYPSKLGELTRKETTYDVWSCNPSVSDYDGDDATKPPVCGEEMKSITCLLPRRSKEGGLYAAPKPISRHVIVALRPAVPQPASQPDPLNSTAMTIYQNPPRHSYPPELLKHQFMPYGSLAPLGGPARGKTDGELEKRKIDLTNDSVHETNTRENTDMNVDLAPPTPVKKVTKEKKNRGKHESEPSIIGDGSFLSATDNSKPSKGKKRKDGGDISEVKKGKRRKMEDA